MSSTLRHRLAKFLFRIRPAPLAAALKWVFCIRREVIKTTAGRFWVDPASNFGARLIANGTYEPELGAVLVRYLGQGGTFVDLGANEGYFSVLGASLVGPIGRVVAIEPQLRLQCVLKRNFALNDIVHATLINRAVSDQKGTAELNIASSMNTGSSSFFRPTRYALASQTVALSTLQEIFEETGIVECQLMKIDIEGWEHEAVLGSPELFRSGRVRVLALELHGYILEKRGLDPLALPHFLRSCGYRQDPDQDLAWIAPERPACA